MFRASIFIHIFISKSQIMTAPLLLSKLPYTLKDLGWFCINLFGTTHHFPNLRYPIHVLDLLDLENDASYQAS